MNYNPNLLRCIRERAYLAGAESAHLEAAAREARRRYFRDLAALDIFTGNSPSPFETLRR